MSTLTLLDAIERPSILGPDRHDDGGDVSRAAVGGTPTLDDLLTGAWDAIARHRPAACLLCDGVLEPRFGAGHAAVAARCTHCGTELS